MTDNWQRVKDSGDNRDRCTMEKRIEVDLFGELDVVIARLQELAKKHPATGEMWHEKLITSVRLEKVWDGYEDCHEDLVIERMETDAEWQARVREIEERERAARSKADEERRKRQRITALENELKKLKKE
jgi:hypothetical protein